MKRTIARLGSLLLAIGTLHLAGCSAEPSSSEIRAIVNRDVKPQLEAQTQALSGLSSMLGGGAAKAGRAELSDVQKVGCKEHGASAYVCDIELVMQVGVDRSAQIVQMRFVKGSSGWMLAK